MQGTYQNTSVNGEDHNSRSGAGCCATPSYVISQVQMHFSGTWKAWKKDSSFNLSCQPCDHPKMADQMKIMALMYEIRQKQKDERIRQQRYSVLHGRYISIMSRILISQDFLCNWKRTPAEPTFGAYTASPTPPTTTISMTSNRNKQCLREDGQMEKNRSNLELAPYARHSCVCARVGWCTNTLWHLLFCPYNEQKRSASTQPVL